MSPKNKKNKAPSALPAWTGENKPIGSKQWGLQSESKEKQRTAVPASQEKMPNKLRNHRLNHEQFLVWNLGTELRARVFNPKTWTLIWKSKLSALDRTVCQSECKKTQSSNWEAHCLRSSLIPCAIGSLLWIPSLPPNLLKKKKNQLSESEDAVSLLSNSWPGSTPF